MTSEEIIKERITDTSEAPRGKDIYYKCMKCGGSIPSQPNDSIECECGNIVIDVGYHRLSIDDYSKMQVVRRS